MNLDTLKNYAGAATTTRCKVQRCSGDNLTHENISYIFIPSIGLAPLLKMYSLCNK